VFGVRVRPNMAVAKKEKKSSLELVICQTIYVSEASETLRVGMNQSIDQNTFL